MATNVHGNLSGDEVHIPYIQVFADESARLADATVYDSNDLYKKALQIDTMSEYVLTSIGPTTWTALSTGVVTVVEEDTKILGMATAFPLEPVPGLGLGGTITVTFPPAPNDLLIKRFNLFSGSGNLSGSGSDFVEENGAYLVLFENVEIDGNPIDSSGVGILQVYTDEPTSPEDINISLLAGESLSIDISLLSGNLGSMNIEYVDLPSILPTQKNYVGAAAPGFTFVPKSTSFATAVLTVTGPTPVSFSGIDFIDRWNNDNTSDLVAQGAPRAPGTGDRRFEASGAGFGGGTAGVALELEDAINDGFNGYNFTAVATTGGPDFVTLTSNYPGPAGNQTDITNPIPEITASARFTGGAVDPPTSIVLEPVAANGTLTSIYILAIGGEGATINGYSNLESLTINAGPNLLDSQLHGELLRPDRNDKHPTFNIPVTAGDIITLGVTNAFIDDLFVVAKAVIE